jgi:hypothetical protein
VTAWRFRRQYENDPLGRIVAYFHEKAAPVKPFLGRAIRTAGCRPTGGPVSLQSFLLRKLFVRPIDTADRRPAGGAPRCHPEFFKSPTRPTSIRTLCGAIAPVPAGCTQSGRVLPSRTRTDALFSEKSFLGRLRGHPNSAILVLAHSGCRFFAQIP